MSIQINASAALAVAIVLEVTATTHLQMSEQLTKLSPTVIMAVCYGASFYFLSIALKTMPIGIAYAVWSALGIVLISAIGYVKFRQTLDTPGMIGIALMVLGVIIANVFSKSVAH